MQTSSLFSFLSTNRVLSTFADLPKTEPIELDLIELEHVSGAGGPAGTWSYAPVAADGGPAGTW